MPNPTIKECRECNGYKDQCPQYAANTTVVATYCLKKKRLDEQLDDGKGLIKRLIDGEYSEGKK